MRRFLALGMAILCGVGLAGCREAAAARVGGDRGALLQADTLVTAGDLERMGVHLSAATIVGDTLVGADARTLRVVRCDLRIRACEPLVEERLRPHLPSRVWLTKGRRVIVATPVAVLATDLVKAESLDTLGRSFGASRAHLFGSMLAYASYRVVPPGSDITIELFDLMTGTSVQAGSVPVATTKRSASAHLLQDAVVAEVSDSAFVVVRLFDGVLWRIPRPLSTPVVRTQLGVAFRPRPTDPERAFPSAHEFVQKQAQLVDALAISQERIALLRNVGFSWMTWNPLVHVDGQWTAHRRIETRDRDGRLIGSGELGEGLWDELASDDRPGCVRVRQRADVPPAPGGLVSFAPETPILVRWCERALS